MIFDNPIWRREWRTRWRDGRAMMVVFALVAAFSFLLVRRYGQASLHFSQADEYQLVASNFATSLWKMVAWAGTLVALVIAPTFASSSIAYERERGLLEGLQLSPLRPTQIIFGKWLSSLAFLLLLWVAILPVVVLLLLVGSIPPGQFVSVLVWHGLTLVFAAGIGIACSAWAQRAHFALRTTYGFLLLWVLSTLAAAYVAGETPFPAPVGWRASFATVWWGRLNPLYAAVDLIDPMTAVPKWPYAGAFMVVLTGLCLWIATVAVKRPLDQAPFIESRDRAKKKKAENATETETLTTPSSQTEPALGHMTVPLVGEIYFQNPVLGREVRGKFRMRQPPLIAILIEILLGIVVAGFYLYIFGLALFEPPKRVTVFYGVAITVILVTVLSCGIMGANGFSREREGGTWEGVQLSLLDARQILWGKVCASLITCALFSIPVLPLILVCIRWNADWVLPLIAPRDAVSPAQMITAFFVWAGSMPLFTMLGLWLGRRKPRSSLAAGVTLGTELSLLIGLPLALVILTDVRDWGWLMGLTNPLVVLLMSASPDPLIWGWATGIPYFLASLIISVFLWIIIVIDVERELDRKAPLGQRAMG